MNKIVIDSDISYWGYSSRWLSRELADKTGDLVVELGSYGGDVFEGISMFNQLKEYDKTKGKVTTVVNSHAMSIASLIFLAGRERKAHKNSTIMIHKAWTWLAGNSDELKAESKVLDGIDMILAKEYGKHMGLEKDEILEVMAKEGWYIGEDQLNTTNFVTEYVESDDEIVPHGTNDFKQAMAKFSAKAIEDDVKPNLDEVRSAILKCNDGKCPLGVNPASAKIEKNNKGNNVEKKFTQEEHDALLAEATKTLNASVKDYEAKMKSLKEQEQKLNDANAKIEASKQWNERLPEVCAMAIERGASANTLVAMITAGDMDKAKAKLVDSMESQGAFGGKQEDSKEKVNHWADFTNK